MDLDTLLNGSQQVGSDRYMDMVDLAGRLQPNQALIVCQQLRIPEWVAGDEALGIGYDAWRLADYLIHEPGFRVRQAFGAAGKAV